MKKMVVRVVLGALFLVSVANLYAQSPPEFLYNSIEEDGQVIKKEVYKLDESIGIHKPYRMREYTYTEDGRIKSHSTLRWNAKKGKWENLNKCVYEYDDQSNTVVLSRAVWNGKKKGFDTPANKTVFRFSEENKAIFYTQYERQSPDVDWSVKQDGDLKTSATPVGYKNAGK